MRRLFVLSSMLLLVFLVVVALRALVGGKSLNAVDQGTVVSEAPRSAAENAQQVPESTPADVTLFQPESAEKDRPARCFGVVLLPDGRPAAGVTVSLHRDPTPTLEKLENTAAVQQVLTLGDGRFAFSEVRLSEAYWLKASHPEHSVQTLRGLNGSDTSSLHPTIRLERGVSLRGSVSDSDARPLAGARVVVYRLAGALRFETQQEERVVICDAQGNYEASGLVVGDKRVTADHPGFGGAAADTVRVVSPSSGPVDFVLVRGGTITGIAVDERTGAPAASVRLRARVIARGTGAPSVASAPTTGKDANELMKPVVRSYPKGTLRSLDPMARDPQALRVSALDPVARFARTETFAISDEQGAFRFEGLVPATYAVDVVTDLFRSDQEWMAATGDSELRIPVTRRATVAGRVVDKNGQPVSRFVVAVSHQAESALALPTTRQQIFDADGRFPALPIDSGSCHVHVWADGFAPTSSALAHLASGEDADIVVTLDQGSRLEGRVTSSEGVPLGGVAVWLSDPFPSKNTELFRYSARYSTRALAAYRTTTDDLGAYVLAGVPEGTFEVHGGHDAWTESEPLTVHVAAEGTMGLADLTMAPASAVSGRLQNPTAGGRILVASSISGVPPRIVDVAPDGSFRCGGLRAGSYRVIPLPLGPPNPDELMRALLSTAPVELALGAERRELLLGTPPAPERTLPEKGTAP